MRNLLTSLNEHPMALLRGIADLRGVELTSNARPEAAAQLAAALADANATAAALASCSPAARAAWSALVASGGRMKAATFSRVYGEVRPVGPGRLEREATWREPANAAEELWYRGLVYRVFAELGEGPLEYIYIPEELAPPSQAGAAPVSAALVLAPAAAPAETRQARNTLAVDACTLLALARETPLAVDKDGGLHEGEVKRLRAALLSGDPLRLHLIVSLVRERGWLAADRGRLVVNHRAAAAWLRATHWEQTTSLFTAWRDSVEWNDLRRVPTLRAEGEWRNDPATARAALVDVLARLDPAAWYSLDDLTAHIKAAKPDFQRPDGNYSGWYLKGADTGRYLSGFEAWDDVEGRLLRFIVEGPLLWLGAVACAAGPESEGTLFRLTRLGEAWLAGGIPAELPRPLRMSVGDDFVVSAPLLAPLLDRFRLLRFTEPAGPTAAEVGSVTRTQHRISRGSLARARGGGITAAAVLDFLKRTTGDRVPPKVAAAIARYDQLGGAARITKGAVLRVEDAAVLATLRADPAIARLLGELISAQAVLVKEADLPRLLALLAESGYEVRMD